MSADKNPDNGMERDEPQFDNEESLGRVLSRAAEQQGLTAADLASMLNLDVKTVRAVLEDRIEDTPGPVYVRAYLKTWAPTLGLDLDVLLARHGCELGLQEECAPVRRETRPTLAVMEPERVSSRWFVTLVWLIAIALLAVVLAALLPREWLDSNGHNGRAEVGDRLEVVTQPVEVAPIEVPPPPTLAPAPEAPLLSAIDEPVAPAAPEEADPAVIEDDTPAPVAERDDAPVPAEEDPAVATETETEEAAPAPAATPGVRIATEGGESWVELTDARGDRLMFGTLAAGERRDFEGQPPFELVLGNPGVVRVEYQGASVDVSPSAGRSTSRLTLGD